MTEYSFATLDRWAAATEARMDAIVGGATERVISEAQKPRSEGGNMPVITSFLRNSVKSSLNDSKALIGPESHVLIAGQMEAGDVGEFEWSAEYARRVNFGFTGTDTLGRYYEQTGAHFLEYATLQWQDIVREETAKAKAAAGG